MEVMGERQGLLSSPKYIYLPTFSFIDFQEQHSLIYMRFKEGGFSSHTKVKPDGGLASCLILLSFRGIPGV